MCHHHLNPIWGYQAFFLLGLLGGLHCLGMCAPLSTLLFSGKAASRKPLLGYHISRVAAYMLTGFVLALLGVGIEKISPLPLVLWGISIPLILYAVGVPLKPPTITVKLQRRFITGIKQRSAVSRALVLGAFTPIIPCGLLYGALAASLAAPSPTVGALWMASFAVGTIPLLFMGQMGIRRIQHLIPPRAYALFLRVLAGITLVLFWIFYWG